MLYFAIMCQFQGYQELARFYLQVSKPINDYYKQLNQSTDKYNLQQLEDSTQQEQLEIHMSGIIQNRLSWCSSRLM